MSFIGQSLDVLDMLICKRLCLLAGVMNSFQTFLIIYGGGSFSYYKTFLCLYCQLREHAELYSLFLLEGIT